MNLDKRFDLYTRAMIKKLPYWFKIRKNSQNSIGAKFLEVIGLEFEEMRFLLDYAYKQVYIDTVDLNQLDILYKGELPEYIDLESIEGAYHNQGTFKIVYSLPEFLGYIKGIVNHNIYNRPFAFIDKERRYIYVHKPYDKNNEYIYGLIGITTHSNYYQNFEIPLNLHMVWNFLDEFGMLLCCPRIKEEDNYSYHKRLLDVFKNVGNSSLNGFVNGLARELNLRKVIIWDDTTKPLTITDNMVLLNKIIVDDLIVPIEEVFLDLNENIVLKAKEKKKSVVVSYISGMELHQLFNLEDIKLVNELYNADNSPKDLLIEYKEKLKQLSPIFWGDFVFDEAYYSNDSLKQEYGYIPNHSDGKIEGLENFK